MAVPSLRRTSLCPRSEFSSGRFTPLLLDHSEYYFRRLEAIAVLTLPIDSGAGTAAASAAAARGNQDQEEGFERGENGKAVERRSVKGILHVCGHSVIFEPVDMSMPVIRAVYRRVNRLSEWQPEKQERAWLRAEGVNGYVGVKQGVSPSKKKGEGVKQAKGKPSGFKGGLSGLLSGLMLGGGGDGNASGRRDEARRAAAVEDEDTPFWQLTRIEAEEVSLMVAGGMHHPYRKVSPSGPLLVAIREDIGDWGDRPTMELLPLLLAIARGGDVDEAEDLLEDEVAAHEGREMEYLEQASSSKRRGEVDIWRGRAQLIEPGCIIPGRLELSSRCLRWRPFHLRRNEPGSELPLGSLFRLRRRRHMQQHTAIEMVMRNNAVRLYMFDSRAECERAWSGLAKIRPDLLIQEWQEWEGISRQWQCGGISNFHYLLHLNGMAQRSFSDLAQYPVFPWVIADYTSETIDLEDPGVYRDLSKPIGALDGERLSSLRERMRGMEEDGEDGDGFLYGTHYSTPAYVIYYMTRSAPEFALHFHGGRFDTPDRAFLSVRGAWEAVTGSSSDVKELIPEFYTSPGTFLRMPDGGLDLGRTQAGDVVGDVVLPPWAPDTRSFTSKLRQALESDHVSQSLHLWIDLIFGHAQRGPAAAEADNLFHPMSYEGALDLEGEMDRKQRRAVLQQISEFGQTPTQLFKAPHPARGGANILMHIRSPSSARGSEDGRSSGGEDEGGVAGAGFRRS